MKKVAWTILAEHDLEAIDDYWIEHSEAKADLVLARIRAAADFLAAMPGAGPVIETGPARKWRVQSTNYILIYRIRADVIQILRVHHGREDWLRHE